MTKQKDPFNKLLYVAPLILEKTYQIKCVSNVVYSASQFRGSQSRKQRSWQRKRLRYRYPEKPQENEYDNHASQEEIAQGQALPAICLLIHCGVLSTQIIPLLHEATVFHSKYVLCRSSTYFTYPVIKP